MEQERKMLKKIEKLVKENKLVFIEQFKVKEIGIFGSVVRGDKKALKPRIGKQILMEVAFL